MLSASLLLNALYMVIVSTFLLVAVVSVEQDAFRVWVASQGLQGVDLGQLCNDLRSRAAVLADMDAIRREAQLKGFEFAKSVTLVLEPFTVEDGLLTPTFKVLEQILGVLIKLVKDLKLQHQHEYMYEANLPP